MIDTKNIYENNSIIGLNLGLSTLTHKDLLNLNSNECLNNNSLIFSCFDPNNTYNMLYEISNYKENYNSLVFINNENKIFPLSFSIVDKNKYFNTYNGVISINIDNNSIIEKYESLCVDINKINRTGVYNGTFINDNYNTQINDNVLTIVDKYSKILNKLSSIDTEMSNISKDCLKLIKNVTKLKDFKNINVFNSFIIEYDKSKYPIYRDNKHEEKLLKQFTYDSENDIYVQLESKYTYFPQFYIDKDVHEFNIILPFKFEYRSKYEINDYLNYINKSFIDVNISEITYRLSGHVNEFYKFFEYPTSHGYTDLEVNNIVSKKNDSYSVIYNKSKSYILDYNIEDCELTENMNIYYGTFYMVLNFTVNEYSFFKNVRIEITPNFMNLSENLITIPIVLRFANDKIEDVSTYDVIYHDYENGFNFEGKGNRLGMCCINNNFFNKEHRRKPLFMSLKNNINAQLNNNGLQQLNLVNINKYEQSPIESSFTNYNNDIKQLLRKVLCSTSENIDYPIHNNNLPIIKKCCLNFCYCNGDNEMKRKNVNGVYIYTINTQNIYILSKQEDDKYSALLIKDYYVLKDNDCMPDVNGYINTVNKQFTLDPIYAQNHININNITFPQTIEDDIKEIYNENNLLRKIFSTVYNICGDSMSKGDYYVPSLVETLSIFTLMNSTVMYVNTLFTSNLIQSTSGDPDKLYYLGLSFSGYNSNYFSIYFKSLDTNSSFLPVFKIPDYNVLSSKNYHVFFDEDENCDIVDYYSQIITKKIILKMQTNINRIDNSFYMYATDINNIYSLNGIRYDYANKEIQFNIPVEIYNEVKKLNKIKLTILYKDTESGMNIVKINDERYRILSKIIIKK